MGDRKRERAGEQGTGKREREREKERAGEQGKGESERSGTHTAT